MSEQLAIDFARTHARSADPVTSWSAAQRAPEFAGNHCERILACLRHYGPQSKDEIAARTGLSGVQVDRRLPDLRAQGRALPTECVATSRSGRDERVWVAV